MAISALPLHPDAGHQQGNTSDVQSYMALHLEVKAVWTGSGMCSKAPRISEGMIMMYSTQHRLP